MEQLANVVTCDYIRGMKAVGIRELKARLSAYVRAVREGETVLVTDRGQVVAQLRPPDQGMPDTVRSRLQRLAARGVVRLGQPNHADLYRPIGPPTLPDGTAKELLDADRGGR